MKKEYKFDKGKRGAVIRGGRKKVRITIRIDEPVLDWFRAKVHRDGGGSYQTLINEALRRFVESQEGDMEDLVRRVLREELEPYVTRAKSRRRRIPSKTS